MGRINIRPVSRLLALAGAGGALGALFVGGGAAIVGGALLGGLAEEVVARVRAKNVLKNATPGAAMGWDPRLRGGVLVDQNGMPVPPPGPMGGPALGAVAIEPGVGVPAMWGGGRGRDTLRPGERLMAGQQIVSPSGMYFVTMQQDGNFVLYNQQQQPLWASNTNGSGAVFAEMQRDGNLIVSAPGRRVWASNTGGPGNRLVMQDDGNLVIYTPQSQAPWASNTVQGQGQPPPPPIA